tara:strand:+ start:134 stop:304 length:171 start_codon:yes stop_codon:yes gene_type:complete
MKIKPPAQIDDEPRTSKIQLRVTPREKARVTRWAQPRGGISKAVLRLIRDALHRDD